ncbi:hypothetical protein ATCV1_z762L [Acanthocystis turfacea chlorella virus 1]|uniref:Uncharacterized protein z762L n=1 Tax=Chlorovirus heliozoae TaxID=322019 RepID=A7KA22_9PHYC|nr:hypothetical protein ATCV1_z762L [Acanthocystis turfacea chlorella virus 1]ABT16896.1 hypothetical protein ATCV1_z762L [Acanthocystis turfacea chlorella virus 1]
MRVVATDAEHCLARWVVQLHLIKLERAVERRDVDAHVLCVQKGFGGLDGVCEKNAGWQCAGIQNLGNFSL